MFAKGDVFTLKDRETMDFQRIVVDDIPLLDVRAPVEFEAGGFPKSTNLPILDDKERHLVGTCYRKNGNAAAIALGQQLVSGDVKNRRLTLWSNYIATHPDAVIYCFRGGKRSQIAQEWLRETHGINIPRLAGGYKALRRYLLDHLNPAMLCARPIVVGGRTGSGKTLLLQKFKNAIDLESLANHRGSTFGRHLSPQPNQTDFENKLAWKLIQQHYSGYKWILLEDEGRHVGRCYLPKDLCEYFGRGKLVLIESAIAERLDILFDEYIDDAQREYKNFYGEGTGLAKWFRAMNVNLDRIKKRLGGERLLRVKRILASAHIRQQEHDDPLGHRQWIEVLIHEYYDPMYDFQLAKNNRPVMFSGALEDVNDFLQTMA